MDGRVSWSQVGLHLLQPDRHLRAECSLIAELCASPTGGLAHRWSLAAGPGEPSTRALTRTRNGSPAATGGDGGSNVQRPGPYLAGDPECFGWVNLTVHLRLILRQHPGIPRARSVRHPSGLVHLIASRRTIALLAAAALLGVTVACAAAGGSRSTAHGRAVPPGRGAPGARRVPRATRSSTRSGRIDPVRYPNFAALASGATWFRNAYSVYDSTTKAVPLILDGRRSPARIVPGPPLPSALHLRRARPPRLPHGERRGGHRPLPAEPLQGGSHPAAGDHPAPQLGPQERFDRFVRSIRPGRGPPSG